MECGIIHPIMKELLKGLGLGAAGILYFVASVAIGLTIAYFGIKFVLSVGDRVFNDDKPKESTETKVDIRIAKDNQEIKDDYIKKCRDNGLNDSQCQCVYNGLWVEFTVNDLRELIVNQKYSEQQNKTMQKIYTNCGYDTAFYS